MQLTKKKSKKKKAKSIKSGLEIFAFDQSSSQSTIFLSFSIIIVEFQGLLCTGLNGIAL